MRDVVVIGGGLSGLAACHALGRRGISATVIEVKVRFGGSIQSRADKGFIADGCAFAIENLSDPSLLHQLGIADATFAFDASAFGFTAGTEALIRALSRDMSGGRLMRMALSSIGKLGSRFTLCLENGLMLDAGAVIIAVPAPYAERMLRVLAPDAAVLLFDFAYDPITRVSLGYAKRDLPALAPATSEFPFVLVTDAPGRVPDPDHILLQFGMRAPADASDSAILQRLRQVYALPAPLIVHIHRWDEADLSSCREPDFAAKMTTIHNALPPGIFLIGSDYCLQTPSRPGLSPIEERLRQAESAAASAIQFLHS